MLCLRCFSVVLIVCLLLFFMLWILLCVGLVLVILSV